MALIKYFSTILIVSLTISNSTQCQHDECHTVCLYPEASFGPKCNNDVRYSLLLDGEKNAILHRHNELRARVAAGKEAQGLHGGQPAGIIGPLEWDNELALVAQRWANQCEFKHDQCRDIGGIYIGQNLGYKGNSNDFEGKFVDIVDMWYAEVQNFDGKLVSKYQSRNRPVTGHYTQLIWAKTTRVGCGGVKYYDGRFYKVHLVCNYGPGGNMIGDTVYPLIGESKIQLNNPDVAVPPSKSKY